MTVLARKRNSASTGRLLRSGKRAIDARLDDVVATATPLTNKPSPERRDIQSQGVYRFYRGTITTTETGFKPLDGPRFQSEIPHNVAQQLVRIRALSRGWDGCEAAAPNEIALLKARRLLNWLASRFQPLKVGASVDGGVLITTRLATSLMVIDCLNTGEVILALQPDQSETVVYLIENEVDLAQRLEGTDGIA